MGANGAVECHPFISEMETVLKQADTVIARSGASSLAEFALFGLPALLVPYPHSTEAHQQSNALFFERHQAAKMVLEKDLSVSQLVSVITLWQRDTALRQRLCQASQQLGQSKATHKVIDLLCHVQAGKT